MPDRGSVIVIDRDELVRIVDQASEGCVESTRAKLRAVAETTDKVAAGWWHWGGVGCPALQAKRRNQLFQERYDRAIFARFGLTFNDDARPILVKVRDA